MVVVVVVVVVLVLVVMIAVEDLNQILFVMLLRAGKVGTHYVYVNKCLINNTLLLV